MGVDPHDKDTGQGKQDGSGSRSTDAWTNAARDRADRLHQRQPARPEREPSKPWFQQLPAKLAGTVVFLVALTTLLGNLLELRDKGRDVLPPATPAAPVTTLPAPGSSAAPAVPAPVTPPVPVRMQVALDRIAVDNDGSPGTTDWRFTVEAEGQPLLAFGQDDLDDTGGRNVVRPKDVAASLRLVPGTSANLQVRGWRLSRFRPQGEPDAVGTGVLPADGSDAAVRVQATEPAGGSFVFYFSADQR